MENQTEFYKAVIGPKNQAYYLSKFEKFDQAGKAGSSWHWPAFFVSFYWLLYRKMWLNAALYFFMPTILMIGLGIVAAMAGSAAGAIVGLGYVAYLLAIFIWVPMKANAWYYKQCQKLITEVRASPRSEDRQLGELAGKGGTSIIAMLIILVFVGVAVLGIVAAVAIPAYQDYVTKARMSQVYSVGTEATAKVSAYYYQHQAPPGSMAEVGFVTPSVPGIREVKVDGQNGVVSISIMGSPAVDGKTLMFIPSLDQNQKIVWECTSEDLNPRYLPPQCKQPQ